MLTKPTNEFQGDRILDQVAGVPQQILWRPEPKSDGKNTGLCYPATHCDRQTNLRSEIEQSKCASDCLIKSNLSLNKTGLEMTEQGTLAYPKPITEEELDRRFLRSAAYHEAGHAVAMLEGRYSKMTREISIVPGPNNRAHTEGDFNFRPDVIPDLATVDVGYR